MWKDRVRACLQKAIAEVAQEARSDVDPESTIRTELDHMVRRTRLREMEQRLQEVLMEIEAVPDPKPRH